MNKEHYQELFENLEDGAAVYEVTNDGKEFIFVDYNTAGQRLDGYSLDDVVGKNVIDIFPGAEGFGILDTFRQVWQSGIPQHHPLSLYKDDKLEFYRTNYIYKLSDDYIVAIYNDETKRQQDKLALQKSEQRFRLLFEKSPVALLREDFTELAKYMSKLRSQGISDLLTYLTQNKDEIHHMIAMVKVIDANSSAVKLFKANDEEHLISNLSLILHGASLDNFRHALLAIWNGQTSFSYDGTNHTLDGHSLNVLLEMNIDSDPHGSAQSSIIVSITDITDRVRLETAKQVQAEQLLETQKMDAIGQLAGGVAHGFNNMLCAITGNVELALLEISPDDPSREFMADIKKAAERSAEFTRQLLAFSKKQDVAPQDIDLTETLRGLHPRLSQLVSDNITLEFKTPKSKTKIRVDPNHIEQMVTNLVLNAIAAMPEGGKLTIETTHIQLGPEECKNRPAIASGPCVVLSVSDTGHGMSPEVKAKVFEPFFTTRETGEGDGLGLASVFGIVEQNGGKIEAISEPGKGATFKVYFPMAQATVATTSLINTTKIQPGTSAKTILVVDDEEMVRRLAVRLIERLGYKVLSAINGQDALAVAARHSADIHLLFTDVVMPNMNGHELATKLIEARPELKVLFTSGYTQNIIDPDCELDEGINFIRKPFMLQSLSTHIRKALGELGG